MIINIILMLIGAALMIYGIKNKTKFFIITGVVLIGLGLISLGIDYAMGGSEAIDIHRLPFMLDGMMR